MHNAKKRRGIVALILAVITVAGLTLPGPAARASGGTSAALPGPQPGPGPKTATVKVPVKNSDGASVNDAIICISYTAPEPTYSGSNKTIHWGTGISCTEDGPFLMSFSGWLYTVWGSGDHTTTMEEDKFVGRSGVYLSTHTEGKFLPCLDNTTHKWVAKFTGTVDGLNMKPTVWWSDVWTFPCS